MSNYFPITIIAGVCTIITVASLYLIVKTATRDTKKETEVILGEIYKSIGKLELLLSVEKKNGRSWPPE